jgi:hypothetical protein
MGRGPAFGSIWLSVILFIYGHIDREFLGQHFE